MQKAKKKIFLYFKEAISIMVQIQSLFMQLQFVVSCILENSKTIQNKMTHSNRNGHWSGFH